MPPVLEAKPCKRAPPLCPPPPFQHSPSQLQIGPNSGAPVGSPECSCSFWGARRGGSGAWGGVLSALGPCGSELGTQFSLPGSRGSGFAPFLRDRQAEGFFPRLSGAEFPKLSPRGHRGGWGPGGWGSSVPPPAVEAPVALQQARAVSGIAPLAGIIALLEGCGVGPRGPGGGVGRERRRSGAVAAGASRSPRPCATAAVTALGVPPASATGAFDLARDPPCYFCFVLPSPGPSPAICPLTNCELSG